MAWSTTRIGGDSLPPYDSFNLGLHVGDQTRLVEQNRSSLMKIAQLPTQPYWLKTKKMVIDKRILHIVASEGRYVS
ncbi:laccase domain-containing protein [Arsenophonus endosymbiont of Bemisia tabaci]|uniref:laccase domain-containing protein n=1 Tax=Arsenophonus endosymbiont of Bemisia tabaci TaxID=536059 RepID=UPI00176C3B79|nr:laccase domain-containing protein [Arsenophonus endosymbiont of Bemisia tabaci]CAA2929511.1 Laccase domain protein YfiH [Arsenophonus endosymbiont of Bemisia tabaci Q2]